MIRDRIHNENAIQNDQPQNASPRLGRQKPDASAWRLIRR